MSVQPGQRVRVHVNLHKANRGEPDHMVIADPSTRRVLQYAADVTLTGVEFRVPEGGLARVRERGAREVFAYAIGTVQAIDTGPDLTGRPKVSFNPFRDDTFVCGGQPIRQASEVTFADRAGWLPGPSRDRGPAEPPAQRTSTSPGSTASYERRP